MPDPAAWAKVEALRKGLAALPPIKATCYRGWTFATQAELAESLAGYKAGEFVRWPLFSSSSGSEHVAQRYAARQPFGVVFEVRGRSGRDITAFAKKTHEQEILFPEGCWFRVDSITPGRIVLTEM